MTPVTTRDVRLALDLVGRWVTARDVEELGLRMFGLLDLVDGTQIALNEVDLTGGSVRMVFGPDPLPDWGPDFMLRHAHEHPLVARGAAGDHGVNVLSDFLSADAFHATALYQEGYARLGAEDQVAFGCPAGPGVVVGVAINRERRGVDERDRALLELIRPHAAAAYALVRERAAAAALLDALDASGHPGLLVLDAQGRVAGGTDRATALAGVGGDGRLPEALAAWVAGCRGDVLADRTLRLRTGALLRFLPACGPAADDVVVVEERADPLGEEHLRELGLSPREGQTLRLAARGLTDAQIAVELGVSVRTVHHHLHATYVRLGVPTRSAAVARVLGLDGHRPTLPMQE